MKTTGYNTCIKGLLLYLLILFGATAAPCQAPVANFTSNTQAGCSPLIVNFQDQSTGSPITWSWNFGNGNTSALQNPTATYFTPGTYTVSLTVTNAGGSNTLTRSQYITVYEPPTVDFTENVRSGCFPLRVQFQDLSTAGAGNTNVAWLWDFGNGTTSALQNPLAIYTTAGNFTVTLRVTNDKGCTRTISRPNYITVTNGVRSVFTNTQPATCVAPATISFTNNSTGPPVLSYLWDFGDGSPLSTAVSPTHTYTGNGTFIAILVTTSTAGCEDTARSTPIVVGGYSTTFSAPASACVNETISFNNTSTPAPVSSAWNFGDGGTATTINATHSYTVPGNYIARLYNTYTNCVDSSLQSITINPGPVADFTAPVTSRCQPPLTVNFQDISTGGAVNWQWDFGDGNTSTLQNPSHTYTSYGSFDVTLIATNGFGCADTIVRPDYIVITRPAITIPLFPVRGCIPHTISPVANIVTVDAVTSYLWDFGDGFTSTTATPTHTYTVQGTYTVKLYITTSSGCNDSLVVTGAVRVGSQPTADFSATPTPVCARQLVYFTDLSTPGTVDEWLWDFGDGTTSILQNPSHAYTDTGCFNVRLIAYNNGCPDTIIKTNYVCVLPPIAVFAVTPDCNDRLRFTFTDQSIAPLTWEWNFGDGSPVVTIQNPVHNFPAYGIYTVTLIVTNGGCADTTTRAVNAVNENPVFDADRTLACKTADINFHVSNINTANIVSYAWDFGDGGTAVVNLPDVTHTYTNAGTYTVTLVTTDVNNCTNTVTRTNYIRINGPVADFSATNTNGCVGLLTTFNDASTGDGTNGLANWQWDFGDGTIQNFSGPPFTHTYNMAGTFSVKLVVTDAAGCQDSLTRVNIIITTDPVPDFISADTLTCPGATVTFTNASVAAGFSSNWDFGDGGTSIITSPTHVYAATGLYDVTLQITDNNGCNATITKPAYIRVDLPVASFNMNDSISSCIPFEIQFTNTSAFYSTFLWDFGPGEGTSTLPNPVHYYTIPGSYLVTLTVTSPGGCTDQTTSTVIVSDTIGSRITYAPISGCKDLQVTLNSFTTGQIASYFWDFGDGYTQTTTVPDATHLYTSWGNFLPKVIMEDPSGCLIALTGLDTVLVTGANTKFGLDRKLFCDFGTVSFSDSTTFNDPVVTYNWNFGDGNTSTQQNPVHTYTSPGIYTVSLATITQQGCRDTATMPNIIKVVQRPLIDIGGDTVVCVNSSLLHTGLFIQPDTSVVTWQWNFPNGTTSLLQNPPEQIYTTAGTFTITTYATNSTGCRDTTTQNILVNPLPIINIPGQMTVQAGFPVTIPATYSPNTVSWIWSPSTGLSCGNCPQPAADPNFNTHYQVYFTDDNGCSNLGEIDVIVICKNANLFVPNTFTPNGDGSNDVFYPRGKGLERIILFRIFNRWGEVVFEKRNFPVNNASFGWDGTYKGNKPKADVYVYQVEVFCDNGDIIRLNGNISLIL
ncbi:MAG: PKD domain-containing protein [Chitinophagaceae bacterium]|nr:PKD domain-containing protein [Chitinophagaceae bacterium]